MVEYSKWKLWDEPRKSKARRSAVIVLDGAKWVASTVKLSDDGTIPDRSIIYSGDGKELVGTYSNKRTFSESRLVKSGDETKASGLTPLTYITLYSDKNTFEEEEKMGGNNIGGSQGLEGIGSAEDLLKELEQEGQQVGAPAGGLESASSFTGDAAPATTEKKQPEKLFSDKIQSVLDKTEIANLDKLWIYNYAEGEFFGYIMNADSKIEFNLRPVPVKGPNGEKQLVEGAPQNIVEHYKTHNKILDNAYVKTEYRLGVRQSRPSKILAVALGMNIRGLVDQNLLREAGRDVMPDTSKPDVRKNLILNEAQYLTFLTQYFGKGIKESKATHGNYASVLNVVPVFSNRSSSNTGIENKKTKIRRKLKPVSGRSSLFLPNNYLPITTFETVSVEGNLSPEQAKDVNFSAFYKVVDSPVVKNLNATKFELMNEEDRANITKVDARTFESRYFTPDAAQRIGVEVKPFWDSSAEPLSASEIEIPLRFEKPKKDGSGSTFPFRKYKTTDEAVHSDPMLRGKASLFSGKFDTFINAVGTDVINLESLSELTRRSSTRGSSKQTIDNETLLKLEMGKADRWFGNEETLEFADAGGNDLAQVSNQIYQLQVEIDREYKNQTAGAR